MKTVLICHHDDDLNARMLPRWLGSFSEVVGIVSIEEKLEQKRNRIKREIMRLGFLRFLDVIAYRLYHRFFLEVGDSAYETKLIEDLTRRFPGLSENIPVMATASPNSSETIMFLRDLKPDLMIARCKVILKPEVFLGARLGTYVMHPGICPEYRNAHGCFWALAENDLDHVGMTLLRIDKGIDTGPIFGFFTYAFDEIADSHTTIQHKTVFENLDRIRDKFIEIERGTAVTIDTRDHKSGNWGQPWLTRYLRWKKNAKARVAAKPFAKA